DAEIFFDDESVANPVLGQGIDEDLDARDLIAAIRAAAGCDECAAAADEIALGEHRVPLVPAYVEGGVELRIEVVHLSTVESGWYSAEMNGEVVADDVAPGRVGGIPAAVEVDHQLLVVLGHVCCSFLWFWLSVRLRRVERLKRGLARRGPSACRGSRRPAIRSARAARFR